MAKITERQAKAERWEGKDRLVACGDGLYLNVRRSSKTWIIRRKARGKAHVTTLGKYPDMSALEARAAALAARLAEDPSRRTVGELAEQFFRDVVSIEQRRPHYFRGYLDRAILPDLGQRRVAEVTPAELAACIQAYRERGARAADQLRSALRALFAFAVEVGLRPDNPAAQLTRRVSGYRPQARARVLTDDELRALWAIASPNGRLLRFLLLTGLRIVEAQRGQTTGERWLVPPELAKNGRAHWVHLTQSARGQLPLPDCTPTNIQAWLRRWCEREQIAPRFTPHDLRRTAATRMAAAGVEPFIVERAIGHSLQGVMAVYNRNEYEPERVAAFETLERALLAVIAAPDE
jgi:integrase